MCSTKHKHINIYKSVSVDGLSFWKRKIPRTMTEVVPSPTSSSWVRLSSIIDLAAGWARSNSRNIAFPSLVTTIPPAASRSIFSMDLGPNVVRIMSATACGCGCCTHLFKHTKQSNSKTPIKNWIEFTLEAWILACWTLLPDSRFRESSVNVHFFRKIK